MLGFENQTLLREAGNGRYKTYEEGLQCSKDIKAAGYVESSALLNEGIQNVSIPSRDDRTVGLDPSRSSRTVRSRCFGSGVSIIRLLPGGGSHSNRS